jgi:PAS domain S-box-containing protein
MWKISIQLLKKNIQIPGLLSNENRIIKNIFQNIFKTAYDATILISDRTIIDCNDKVIELFDYKKNEIFGKTLQCLYPLLQPNGEDISKNNDLFSEQIYTYGNNKIEWYLKKKNGQQLLTELTANLFKHKKRTYTIVTIRNITLNKKEKKQLYAYRYELEQLVN